MQHVAVAPIPEALVLRAVVPVAAEPIQAVAHAVAEVHTQVALAPVVAPTRAAVHAEVAEAIPEAVRPAEAVEVEALFADKRKGWSLRPSFFFAIRL